MDPGELLDRLLRLTDALSLDMDGHLAGLGLTRTKGHLLWVLHGGGPARQRDLATALGHTPRHVTTLVDELITAGYVTRRPHPDDRRAVLVELTARGSSLLDEMALSRTALSDRLFGGLAARQRSELGDRLAELHTTVTALIEDQRATEDQRTTEQRAGASS